MILGTEQVHEWADNETPIEIGDEGSDVSVLQALLEEVDEDLYEGKVDGKFGKMSRSGVLRYQQLRMIPETGVVDALTKKSLCESFDEDWHPGQVFRHPTLPIEVNGTWHPRLGYLPDLKLGEAEYGKISTFGGPDDKCDRIYGQAYISGYEAPKELASRRSKLIEMGILRPEIATLDEFPMVTDRKGRLKRASTSWALNPASYYIAMRWLMGGKSLGYMNEKNPRLLVWCEGTGKAVVCLRTDYGPSVDPSMPSIRLMDLSDGAADWLQLKTDQRARVCWALDDAPLGPVELLAT